MHKGVTLNLYWLDNPDQKFRNSIARATRKNQKNEDELGWRPIVLPLGRFEGVAHYAVVTDHSAHVCGFQISPDGKRLAGCECRGGLGEHFCYHVDEAEPRHNLFVLLERMSPAAAETMARQGQEALRTLLKLMRHATGADGERAA